MPYIKTLRRRPSTKLIMNDTAANDRDAYEAARDRRQAAMANLQKMLDLTRGMNPNI